MKKFIFLSIFTFSTLLSFGQKKEKIKGDRDVISVSEIIVNSFNTVEVDDNLEVNIKQGSRNSYILTTDKNLVSSVRFTVIDSVLKIYIFRNIVKNKKLEIDLNVTDIAAIILKNDAKIKSNNTINTKSFSLSGTDSCEFDLDIEGEKILVTMQGNVDGKLEFKGETAIIVMNDRTDLDVELKVETLDVTLNDNAELRADGKSDLANYTIKKSSDLNARKLEGDDVILNASNNSDVYLNASKTLTVSASGKSEIYVYGKADIAVKELSDKSKIIKK